MQIGYRWLSKKSAWPGLSTGEALGRQLEQGCQNGKAWGLQQRAALVLVVRLAGTEGSREAGRVEGSARVFRQCRRVEQRALPVQSVCSGGDAWGQLLWLGSSGVSAGTKALPWEKRAALKSSSRRRL